MSDRTAFDLLAESFRVAEEFDECPLKVKSLLIIQREITEPDLLAEWLNGVSHVRKGETK